MSPWARHSASGAMLASHDMQSGVVRDVVSWVSVSVYSNCCCSTAWGTELPCIG